ncbi:MAG: PfkB family carbohydrate kinase [Rectinemataceae bacterium]|nr:PfkB family carbohydrate kinase [Rectinemataceae bacterium]
MKYDIVCIGHITGDIRNMMGEKTPFTGGAAFFSPCAAARSGARVFVLTRMADHDALTVAPLRDAGIDVRVLSSPETTGMENIFLTPDPDKRSLRLYGLADPFDENDLATLPEAEVYHMASLFRTELPDSLIPILAGRGRLALDVQAVLRYFSDGDVRFAQWSSQGKYMPFVHYLKADSHEITVMTGSDDREAAARLFYAMGAREIVITRQDEALAYDGSRFCRAPFNPRSLEGRAGRGDSCFLAYIAWRKNHDIDESIHYAAALTSIKMETAGPFSGKVGEVLERMKTLAY